jgi:hypothetical protein
MFACAASVALPRVDRPSEYADRGQAIHAYVDAVLSGIPPQVALDQVPEDHRFVCSRLEWVKLGGDLSEVETEVAFAIDMRDASVQRLGRKLGRAYVVNEHQLPGTLDIMGVRLDGVPVVIDLKTGWGDVAPAKENPQLLFFASVLQTVTRKPAVEVRIVRINAEGQVGYDSHEVTRFDIDSYIDDLCDGFREARDLEAHVDSGGSPDVTVGAHCRHCDSVDWCPAYTRLALAVAGETDALVRAISNLPDDKAGAAWTTARQVETTLGIVLDGLKLRARTRPFPVGEGKVVRETTSSSVSFNVKGSVAMLRALGASDEQVASLYRTTPTHPVRETNDPKAPKAARKKRAT